MSRAIFPYRAPRRHIGPPSLVADIVRRVKAVVIGAGIAGLSVSGVLCDRGWDVTVLDSDDYEPPATLTNGIEWVRRGTPHALQAHGFMGGFVRASEQVAPGVAETMRQAGAFSRNAQTLPPPTIDPSGPHSTDDEIQTIGATRPFVEWHLRRAVAAKPGLDVRAGLHVSGLALSNGTRVPRVTGVKLDGGARLDADLVIDASGRRSRARSWLSDEGVRLPEPISMPCETGYHSRHYRLRDPSDRLDWPSGHMLVAIYPTFAALLFPAENGTMQAALGTLADDPMFERARDNDVFHAVQMTAEEFRPWLDPVRTEPISDVAAYGRLNNSLQRLVVDGTPVVTGFHFVGDSGAITNPRFGRGVSHAAVHGVAVARIASEIDDPNMQAIAVDDEITRMIEPSLREAMHLDRQIIDMSRDALAGRLDGFRPVLPELPEGVTREQYLAATSIDPVVWRAVTRSQLILEPPGAWRHDADVVERLRSIDPPDMPMPPEEALRDMMKRVEDAIASV